MLLSWIELIGGLIILIAGGDFLVRTSVKLALFLRISSMVIGLTVVSFGTSFPELVVSLDAALGDHPDIALGNVVGSNIANLALVLGLSALLYPMAVKRTSVVFDWPVMLVATALLIAFAWDGIISAWEGLVLLFGIIAYNVVLIRASRIANDEGSTAEEEGPTHFSSANVIRVVMWFVLSLAALILGAELLVEGAVGVARSFGVEERVIGLTIVAFGTSAPELATSLIALHRNETSISVGNLIGSNIFNIFGILGVTAVCRPIPVNPAIQDFDFYWAIGIPLLLFPLLLTRMKLSRYEGGMLFLSYICYIWLLF
jgi:cation:H+ antiporter